MEQVQNEGAERNRESVTSNKYLIAAITSKGILS